jgi:cephalosporin hydroxylase
MCFPAQDFDGSALVNSLLQAVSFAMPLPKFVREKVIKKLLVDSYHQIWYDSPDTWQKNTYLGFGVQQAPSDLWIYQELVFALKPSFILQTGVCQGGSILYFAHLLDLMKAPESAVVIGVDIVLTSEAKRIDHPRVRLIEGSSIGAETLDRVRALLPAPTGFVSLDSDHSESHVLAELEAYAQFVAVGSYMVAEDTNVNGHPVSPDFGLGPYEAVQTFLQRRNNFVNDDSVWQRHLFSQHQRGWLKRTA